MLYTPWISTALQFFFVPERNHWVLTTYTGNEVRLYDSAYNGQLSRSLEHQICQVYRNEVVNGSLLVAVVPVQQQTGDTECGVMAIANAYHATIGDDLTTMTFSEQEDQRKHLSMCFESKKFSTFPHSKCVSLQQPQHIHYINIEVSCKCQRPDSYQDMIECDKCDKWYHLNCARLTTIPEGDWYCVQCS